MLRRFETVEGQANLLADWQALGDWRLADRYLEEILSADVDDLRRVARRHLSLERATVLEYRPEGAAFGEGRGVVGGDKGKGKGKGRGWGGAGRWGGGGGGGEWEGWEVGWGFVWRSEGRVVGGEGVGTRCRWG